MKKLLEFLVSKIVENPKEVKIQETGEADRIVFTLKVAPSDIGRVIGKNGQIIRALRTLVRTSAFKEGKKVDLLLEEEAPS